MHKRPLRLLVVDDSAVMRQAMIAICRRAPDIEVRVAADPLIAQAKMRESRPDVILLDIEMPRMDGLTFLRKLMADRSDAGGHLLGAGRTRNGDGACARSKRARWRSWPSRASRCTTSCTESTEMFDRRRSAPPRTPRARRAGSRCSREAALARRRSCRRASDADAHHAQSRRHRRLDRRHRGAARDPRAHAGRAPGIVIVQHMPEVFTAAFAQRLNRPAAMEVKEAADGDRIIDGRALIAPGNRHVLVVRDGAEYRVQLNDGPLVSRHKPSVDVLFRSVAQSAGPQRRRRHPHRHGQRRRDGLLEMHAAGAATIAQDEATCVVFGMPAKRSPAAASTSCFRSRKIAATILLGVQRS